MSILPYELRRSRKYRYLLISCRWDHAYVPVYEATGRKGRCPLLKTLVSSYCRNECKYCALRRGRSVPRERWTVDKLASVAAQLYKEGRVKGLFLSSSIDGDPDEVVAKEVEIVRKAKELGFRGYVHLRLMPGVSRWMIKEAASVSDRIGLNMEAPEGSVFSEMCPDKGDLLNDVFKRLAWAVEEARKAKCKAGVDTQFVVGATGETDWLYIKATYQLYKGLKLRRIYYSGFEPIPGTPYENKPPCASWREHRLYQVSFLIRDYNFTLEELQEVVDEEGFLWNEDPKLLYVKKHPELFPVDLNEASIWEIMRIPKIGPIRARRIVELRKKKEIKRPSDLKGVIEDWVIRRIIPYVAFEKTTLL